MDPQTPVSRTGKKETSGAEHTRQKPKQPDPEDFRKFLDDESTDREAGSDKAIAKERKADIPLTPFDLAAGAKVAKPKQAPFAMMMGKEAKLEETSPDLVSVGEKTMPQPKLRSDTFAQTQTDLSFVNPAAMAVQAQDNVSAAGQPAPQGIDRASLQALVEQLVDKLYTVNRMAKQIQFLL